MCYLFLCLLLYFLLVTDGVEFDREKEIKNQMFIYYKDINS